MLLFNEDTQLTDDVLLCYCLPYKTPGYNVPTSYLTLQQRIPVQNGSTMYMRILQLMRKKLATKDIHRATFEKDMVAPKENQLSK